MSKDAAVFDATPLDSSQIRALQLNFLADVNPAIWEPILLGAIHRLYLPPFKMLYRQEKPVTAVYILASGRINQYREETVQGQKSRLIARTVGEGKLLGHLEFLYGIPYTTYARSEDACELLAIDAQAFSRLIYYFPGIRERLFPKEVADRLSTFPFMRRLALSPALHPIVSGFLADETTHKVYRPGQTIYRRGDLSECIYLIHQGQVQLELAGHPKETHLLGNGAMFGAAQDIVGFIGMGSVDRYMLHDATSQAKTDLYCIPYHSFKSITGLNPEKIMHEDINLREQMIDRLPMFARLNAEERRTIVGYVSHFYLPHVRLLIHQGEVPDSLWVLVEGRASVRALDKDGRLISSATAIGPTYFAEQALLGQVSQESTVEAQAGSEWLRFHWRDLEAVSKRLGADLRPRLKIKRTDIASERSQKSRQLDYEWLEPGEKVVLQVRRHWIAFFVKNTPAILLFLVALALYGLSGWAAGFAPGLEVLLRAAIITVLVLGVAALIWGIIDYWNDWLMITDLRVIHQEKVLFVTETREEASLEQIQNVNQYRTLAGRLFNYGAITIETAATVGVIRFDYAKDFNNLRKEIVSRREQRRRHAEAANRYLYPASSGGPAGAGYRYSESGLSRRHACCRRRACCAKAEPVGTSVKLSEVAAASPVERPYCLAQTLAHACVTDGISCVHLLVGDALHCAALAVGNMGSAQGGAAFSQPAGHSRRDCNADCGGQPALDDGRLAQRHLRSDRRRNCACRPNAARPLRRPQERQSRAHSERHYVDPVAAALALQLRRRTLSDGGRRRLFRFHRRTQSTQGGAGNFETHGRISTTLRKTGGRQPLEGPAGLVRDVQPN